MKNIYLLFIVLISYHAYSFPGFNVDEIESKAKSFLINKITSESGGNFSSDSWRKSDITQYDLGTALIYKVSFTSTVAVNHELWIAGDGIKAGIFQVNTIHKSEFDNKSLSNKVGGYHHFSSNDKLIITGEISIMKKGTTLNAYEMSIKTWNKSDAPVRSASTSTPVNATETNPNATVVQSKQIDPNAIPGKWFSGSWKSVSLKTANNEQANSEYALQIKYFTQSNYVVELISEKSSDPSKKFFGKYENGRISIDKSSIQIDSISGTSLLFKGPEGDLKLVKK